jgi:PBP1b-binding outer membrane lipoprotein LpoB
MNSHAILSLVTCTLGAVVIAGCASPPPPPAQASASAQGTIQSGKVIAMRTFEATPEAMIGSTSGASASGTAASGTEANASTSTWVTVQFADGSQTTYNVERHDRNYFTLGDPISIVSNGDSMVIMAP